MKRNHLRSKVVLALFAATFVLGFGWFAKREDESRKSMLLPNRIWLERISEDPRAMAHELLLVDQKELRHVGLASYNSAFRLQMDGLNWRLENDRLKLLFLQEDVVVDFDVRAWECDDAPEPLTMCLELKRGDRVFRFYSSEELEIDERGLLNDDTKVRTMLGRVAVDIERLRSANDVERRVLGEPEWIRSFTSDFVAR
jgi:hypothetical protein